MEPPASPPPRRPRAEPPGDQTPDYRFQGDYVAGDKHITQHAQGDIIGRDKVVINLDRTRLDYVFLAPPLPPHFVPRPEASAPLKEQLLAPPGGQAGILSISALHGLGGIGKSTLAAALAHDPDVQAHFTQGVLWATLGQQPDLLSLLAGWIQALGDYDFYPTTTQAATAHLRALLRGRAALLVVDDAWDVDHVRPFLVGGAQCRVLITTRRADIVDEVGAERHLLSLLTEAQSLALLTNRLRRALMPDETDHARRLARAVGYLPMALEQAAARVLRGAAWTDLVASLEAEIARLEVLHGPRQARLEASFNLSLNSLRALDEAAWAGFAWLGVLPEDALLAAPAAAVLWGVTEGEADQRLELLWNDALLLPGSPVEVEDRQWSAYRPHDLLHDIARRILTGPAGEGLGFALPQAHAELLGRYRRLAPDGAWHALRPDGYVHYRLVWHLEQAGWDRELHALMCPPESGRHAWYAARERLGQVGGFMEDLARGWGRAERTTQAQSGSPEAVASFGLELRYALMAASILNLARNLPPRLVAQLVGDGIWSQAQALSYAQAIHAPVEQLLVLAELLPRLDAILQAAVKAELLQRLERIQLAEILIALDPEHGPYLADYYRSRSPEEAIPARPEQAQFLLQVSAGLLPPDRERVRLSGVKVLMAYLEWDPHPPADYVQRVIPFLEPAEILTCLQHCSKPIDFSRMISLGEQDEARLNRVATEALLVAKLPPSPDREPALEALLETLGQSVEELGGWGARTNRGIRLAVQALGPVVSGEALDRLAIILEETHFVGETSQALAWASLAAHAGGQLHTHAVEQMSSALQGVSRLFSNDDDRVFLELLPQVARLGYAEQAIEAARKSYNPLTPEVLDALAPALPQPLRLALLRQELPAILSVGDQVSTWTTISKWMETPSVELDTARIVDEALARSERNPSSERSLESLKRLIENMDLDQVERTLAIARQATDWRQASAVMDCAKRFAKLNQPQRALALVRGLERPHDQVRGLKGLVPALADVRTLEDTLDHVDALQETMDWVDLMQALSLRLFELGSPEAAWRAIEKLIADRPKSLLRRLADEFAARGHADMARRIVGRIGAAPESWWPPEGQVWEGLPRREPPEKPRAGRLPPLEPDRPAGPTPTAPLQPVTDLPPEWLQEELQAIREIQNDDRYKAEALLALAERAPLSDLPEITAAASRLPDPYARARALTRLCQHLAGDDRALGLRQALEAAAAIDILPGIESDAPEHLDPSWTIDGGERSQVLDEATLLMESLPPGQGLALIQGVLHQLIYRSRADLYDDLRALRHYLLELFGPACAREVIAAILAVTSWWP